MFTLFLKERIFSKVVILLTITIGFLQETSKQWINFGMKENLKENGIQNLQLKKILVIIIVVE